MQCNGFAACAQFAPHSRALRASREAACGKLSKHLHVNEKLCDERRALPAWNINCVEKSPRLLLPGGGGPRLTMLLVRT